MAETTMPASIELEVVWGSAHHDPPGSGLPWRRVGSWLLWQYHHGTATFELGGGQVVSAGDGEMILLPPWTHHRINLSPGLWARGMRFNCACFGHRDLADCYAFPLWWSAADSARPTRAALQVLRAHDAFRIHPGPGELVACEQAKVRLLSALVAQGTPKAIEPAADERLRAILTAMHAHIDRPFTRDAMARTVDLKPSHFASWFRERTGLSPARYLRRLRLREASRLLETTDLDCTAIAQRVGYGDPFHFSRAFKRTLGVSPTAWRQEQRLG